MNKIERKLEIALEALKYYSKTKDQINEDRHRPGLKEFGCGCCAKIVYENETEDYDDNIIGKTARDALERIDQIEKEE